MLSNLFRCVFLAAIPLVATACGGGSPEPLPSPDVTQVQPSSDRIVCDQLDFQGEPKKPDVVTLVCSDGDKINIPGPIEPGDVVGEFEVTAEGERVPGNDGALYIPSESGEHFVWYYLMTPDGVFRVWHDEELIERTPEGKEKRSSKVTIRNFSLEPETTKYVTWEKNS